jgi:Carboxypeptidase regulatory-like domain
MSEMAIKRQLRDNSTNAGIRSPMKIFLSTAVLFVLCTFPLLSQENKPLTLEGSVVRQDGTGLGAAHVFVRDYQAGTQWEMRTEGGGGFSFVVDPGCYDIFISQAVFLPFFQRVCVHAGSNPIFRLRLRADCTLDCVSSNPLRLIRCCYQAFKPTKNWPNARPLPHSSAHTSAVG